MQNTIGISILTGAFWARSWASWRRLMRISSAWARSTRPIETPNVSACRMASTNERTSGTLVRWSRARMASARLAPARTSPSIRENSSDSAPGTAEMVRSSACSKPRPASTLMVSRSRMSGSLTRRSCWRSSTRRLSMASGPTSTANIRMPNAPVLRHAVEAERVPEEDEPEDRDDGGDGDDPDGEEAVDGVGGAVAGPDELLADVVDVADRGEAPTEVGEPAEHRGDGPLGDRGQELLVADVLDLVAVELAQRVAHDRLLVDLREHGVDRRARWRRR